VRITLFGLAAIAIIGAIVAFIGPYFISTMPCAARSSRKSNRQRATVSG
jgi:hypothetical protein